MISLGSYQKFKFIIQKKIVNDLFVINAHGYM